MSAENDGGKWWIGNAETDPLLPAEKDVPVWCSEHMEPYCPRHSAEIDALRHRPFGITHPTWDQPTNFYYNTEAAAWTAIKAVYGEGSGHLVVGVLTRPIPPGQWDEEADALFIDKAREATRLIPPGERNPE